MRPCWTFYLTKLMKNILHPADQKALLDRLDKLSPESPALWGRMNASQMICHLADQIRLATGDIPTRDQSNFFTRTVLKHGLMLMAKTPKGKAPTAPEIDQVRQAGTPPTTWENDLALLRQLLERIAKDPEPFAPHPLFGQMTRKQWGRMVYIHMDHHISQFGG